MRGLIKRFLISGLLFLSCAPFLFGQARSTDPVALHVATFDSGFGGFFTAKSIEKATPSLLERYDTSITIRHYGDTLNSPYGEKSPADIAKLGSDGVLKALDEGADMVFIACNTASTQYDKIEQAVDRAYPGRSRDVFSIVDTSAHEAKRLIDQRLLQAADVHFAILATPATVKSMVYPRRLAQFYGVPLSEENPHFITQPRWLKSKGDTVQSVTQVSVIHLPGGKTIHIYQMAPANWVELIEHGADLDQKNDAVKRDLALLFELLPPGARLDTVGYFCTHFPAFDEAIRQEITAQGKSGLGTEFILQGPLMANIFEHEANARLKDHRRLSPISSRELARLVVLSRASITISGDNVEVTRQLTRTLFPGDPTPAIRVNSFIRAKCPLRQCASQESLDKPPQAIALKCTPPALCSAY
jgi:glutamate racemase